MTKKEVVEAINKAPVFYLATEEGNQPRVRGMLLYKADEHEIANHPSRTFLDQWRNAISIDEFHQQFAVFRLTKGIITLWTMERNLEPKIELDF